MEKQVELCSREVEMVSEHIQRPQKEKGGFVTMPFIMGKLCFCFTLLWFLMMDSHSFWFWLFVLQQMRHLQKLQHLVLCQTW